MAQHSEKYCIIGAGAAGITAAKNLKQRGIAFDVIEREDEVGGNWYYGRPNSSVYKSTHLLSSKPMTAYTDFPMPADYPDYLRQDQVCAYLRSYARHFDLYPHIQFNTSVEKCERSVDGGWIVSLSGGEKRHYAGLIICNGHHWDPIYPDFPGKFEGEALHTKFYKTPEVLHGKRVLVIGAGNSGCDLVVEAVHHAEAVYHSTRRGYYYVPKFILGRPVDQIDQLSRRMGTPKWIRGFVNMLLLRLVMGDPTRYGLPRPDHKLLQTHPIVNQQMLYHVGHGDVMPKPNVKAYEGRSVRFVDNTSAEIDLIIYATGFKISFPFIDTAYLNWQGNGPGLYLHAFHPHEDDLFVIGLLQPDSGLFWLMDYQAQAAAAFIEAQRHDRAAAERFRQIKAGPQPDIRGGTKHIDSQRHFVEIDHWVYKRQIKKVISLFRQPAKV